MKLEYPHLPKTLGTIIQENYGFFYPSGPFRMSHFEVRYPVVVYLCTIQISKERIKTSIVGQKLFVAIAQMPPILHDEIENNRILLLTNKIGPKLKMCICAFSYKSFGPFHIPWQLSSIYFMKKSRYRGTIQINALKTLWAYQN